MKKAIFVFALALALVSGGAMAVNADQNAPAKQTAVKKNIQKATQSTGAKKKTTTAKSANKVIVLKDDNKYRPGMKVKRLTVLDFNATWCGPCKQFAPAFEKAATTYGNKADFISIDVDVNPKTAGAFGVSSLPTVMLIHPNGTTQTYIGTGEILPASQFLEIVKTALK